MTGPYRFIDSKFKEFWPARPESHDVEVRLPPSVLVLEDLRLLDELRLHLLLAAEVQQHEREAAAENCEHLLPERNRGR